MSSTDFVFVINPGSTSTKLAYVGSDGGILWQTTLEHQGELDVSSRELVPLRARQVREVLTQVRDPQGAPRAVVGRGGPLRPLEGGTYHVNDLMIEELLSERWARHPSNLGAPLAREFAAQWQVPAYVVDPVSVDNFTDVARVSGIPEITRRSRSHALNIRSCAHLAASELKKELTNTRLVIAHLGGGISIAAVEGGRIVDVNDGLLGMGPFSPERAGALPLEGLIDLCYSGKHTIQQLKSYLSKGAGFKAYLGTSSFPEVEKRLASGDEQASLIFRAMVYQIAKEIGACAAVLKGRLDAVVLTGGLANSPRLVAAVEEFTSWLGMFFVYPGEREMEAMAAGAYRVLQGKETAQTY